MRKLVSRVMFVSVHMKYLNPHNNLYPVIDVCIPVWGVTASSLCVVWLIY
jgi:hypothetical protein